MMQAKKVIDRAFRALGVIAAGESAAGPDAADALDALNSMFAEWRGAGIPVPDFAVAALTTELSIDAADRDAVALKLADRIGGEYGSTLSPRDLDNMESAFHRMQLRYFATETFQGEGMPSSAGGHNCQ